MASRCSQTCSYCLRFRSNEKKYQVQANVGANVQPFNEEDTPSHPRTQASIKLAVQITYSADEIKAQLGQQTTNAVCQAVRSVLDRLWNIMASRQASTALKDVPVGKTIKFKSVILLWKHEMMRVIAGRFTTIEDKN
ncbi:unnamed protein product [Heterobilharzia americana]|nr:unnamed protein product [Heterobilharzia americana]